MADHGAVLEDIYENVEEIAELIPESSEIASEDITCGTGLRLLWNELLTERVFELMWLKIKLAGSTFEKIGELFE